MNLDKYTFGKSNAEQKLVRLLNEQNDKKLTGKAHKIIQRAQMYGKFVTLSHISVNDVYIILKKSFYSQIKCLVISSSIEMHIKTHLMNVVNMKLSKMKKHNLT